jgi:hypothetical protein
MVAAVTAEIQVQVDAMEELSPTIDPLQTEIAALKKQSSDLQDEIAALKVKVASAATEKDSKEDVISNTTNDIKILREAIEMKRAELEPLPAKIEVIFEKRIGGGGIIIILYIHFFSLYSFITIDFVIVVIIIIWYRTRILNVPTCMDILNIFTSQTDICIDS